MCNIKDIITIKREWICNHIYDFKTVFNFKHILKFNVFVFDFMCNIKDIITINYFKREWICNHVYDFRFFRTVYNFKHILKFNVFVFDFISLMSLILDFFVFVHCEFLSTEFITYFIIYKIIGTLSDLNHYDSLIDIIILLINFYSFFFSEWRHLTYWEYVQALSYIAALNLSQLSVTSFTYQF